MTSTTALATTLMADEPQPRGLTCTQAVNELLDRLDRGAPIIDTLRTGIALLDDTTGGLVRGEFCGFVAAPGLGKSTISDGLVVGALMLNPDTSAVVFNLETGTAIRVARLICGRSVETNENNAIARCVPLGPLLRGELRPDAREHAKAVARELAQEVGGRLSFVDDLYDAKAIAEEIRARTPDVVLIDHAGLLDVAGPGSLVERFDEALHAVTAAIKEAHCAGVIISELSKAALTAGAADIGAVRGSARFASLAGQLVTIKRDGDDENMDPRLFVQLHKSRHGKSYVQEAATLFGGLAHVSWSGVVTPIPTRKRGAKDG